MIEIRDAAEDKWVLLQSLIRGTILLVIFVVIYVRNNFFLNFVIIQCPSFDSLLH